MTCGLVRASRGWSIQALLAETAVVWQRHIVRPHRAGGLQQPYHANTKLEELRQFYQFTWWVGFLFSLRFLRGGEGWPRRNYRFPAGAAQVSPHRPRGRWPYQPAPGTRGFNCSNGLGKGFHFKEMWACDLLVPGWMENSLREFQRSWDFTGFQKAVSIRFNGTLVR